MVMAEDSGTAAPMTAERLAKIRALLSAVTPGEWEMYRYPHGNGRIFVNGIGNHYKGRALVADAEPEPSAGATVYHKGDLEFLFASPTVVARLLAEVDRLRAEAAHCPRCDHPTGEHFGAWCRTHIGHNRICGCSAVTSVSTPAYGRVEFANHPASEHTP